VATVNIRNLNKTFNAESRFVHAIKDVNLDIEDGEFVCVVGHSGCGKTTMLNILGGFLPPTSGQILIEGKPIQEVITSDDVSIGVVFQEYALFPWRTAVQNIEFGMEMLGIAKRERRRRAAEFLRLVHLEEFADVYPHELSGGMRQRVAVARALAYEPALLLMDEPFGALDAQTRERLQILTEDIWMRTKKTIFYVTHNLSEAVYLANRIVVMRPGPGRIHEIVNVSLPRPRDPFDSEFVDIERRLNEAIREDVPTEGRAAL
jgi:ABC-type nitrate/sulfonate/bicarbonate transport system ATPase subunit